MTLKHFHDKMKTFSSLIFHFIFFYLCLTLLVSSLGHLWVYHSSATSNVPKSSTWFGSIFWSFRLPWWSDSKESACQCWRPRFDPWVRKIPWRREWHPTPVFLSGKSHGQISLVGYSPWGHKESDMPEQQRVKNLPAIQETQVQSLGQEDLLEKGLAPHSCILAWEIPWTEEPGRRQSLGFKVLDMIARLTLFGKMFADILKYRSEISLWN